MQRIDELLAAEPADAERLARAVPAEERADVVEGLASEVLRQLRIDAHSALRAADLAEAVADNDEESMARARWVRGHALAALLRGEEALAAYDDAGDSYTRLGRRVDSARIGIGQVNALTLLGRYDQALAVGERTRTALGRAREKAAAARLDVNLGNLYHRIARPERALACYDRALRVARGLDSSQEMRETIQLNRGTALSALGRTREATDLYREVRDAAARAGEIRVRAFAEFNLGYLYFQRGDYGRAWDTLDSARQAFEEIGDRHFLALTLVDVAELLLETSSWRRAATAAERARDLAASLGLRLERARAVLMRAVAKLGSGEEATAESDLAQAELLFSEEGNPGFQALAEVYRARLDFRRGRVREAERRASAAATRLARSRLRIQEMGARLMAAEAALAGNRHRQASRQLELAARHLRSARSPWLRARHAHLRGRLAESRGRRADALRAYRTAVRRLEEIRGRIGIDEFRIGFGDATAHIYADLVEIVLERGGARSVADAFEVIERSRSRSLVDLLEGRLHSTGRADTRTEALLDRLDGLRGELNRAAGYSSERGSGLRQLGVSGRPMQVVEEEIAETTRRLQRHNSELGTLIAGETSTLGSVRANLPPDVELVEFYLGERSSWAIVATNDGARAVRLPDSADAVRTRVSRLRFQIEKRAHGDEYAHRRSRLLREGADRHLQALSDAVLAPLELEASKVVFVPHGPLHAVPFAALPDADGEPLVERRIVSVIPSASCRRFVDRPSRRDPRDRSVLAVSPGTEDLPGAQQEITRVRRAFRHGRILRGNRATWRAFRETASEADVVHIATHGLFRPDDPAFSALLLQDGWVRIADLLTLELQADLVCLSTCQSGRVGLGAGDEMVGLCRGFLHAGARSLLVSLWSVEDRTTESLMTAVYREMRSGTEPAEALALAMREIRRKWEHPFHWAPFVAVAWPGQGVVA